MSRGLRAAGRKNEQKLSSVLRRHVDEVFQKEADNEKAKRAELEEVRCKIAVTKALTAKAKNEG